MSEQTPKGRTRAELDVDQVQLVRRVLDTTATIDALEAQLTNLYRARVELYVEGIALNVPKVRMAEAAGCDMTAIIHAVRKRDRQLAELAPVPSE